MVLKAGVAEVVITPPVGVELAGYGFGPSVDILEDLKAQALVLRGDENTVVLLTVDLLMVGPELVARVRRRVEDEIGIHGDQVLIAASHSHSAPTAMPLRQWGRVDDVYVRALEDHLVGAVKMAADRAEPASLTWGQGRVTAISENRRDSPIGIDPTVPVLRVNASDGEPIAVFTNFGCHPVTLHSYRNLLSPDYPATMRRVVREIFSTVIGRDPVVMFTMGTAGDVNPAGYVAGGTTPERSRQVGAVLGCEVARVALDPVPAEDEVIRVARRTLDLPVAPLPPADELREMVETFSAEADRRAAAGAPWPEISVVQIKRDWATDALAAVSAGSARTTVPCEAMVVRLGPVAVVALPLEVFTATGIAVKTDSPAEMTVVVTNANGGVGYLPTEDAYEGGDYTNPEGLAPKVYGLYAFAPAAEPLVRDGVLDLINTLFDS